MAKKEKSFAPRGFFPIKRKRRLRRRGYSSKPFKKCEKCGTETRWLSVDGLCWDCTVKDIKNKVPLFIEPASPEDGGEAENIFE